MRCFNDPCTLQAFQLYHYGKYKNINCQILIAYFKEKLCLTSDNVLSINKGKCLA